MIGALLIITGLALIVAAWTFFVLMWLLVRLVAAVLILPLRMLAAVHQDSRE